MTDSERRTLRWIRYAKWLFGISLMAMILTQFAFGRDFAGIPFLIYACAMGVLAVVCFAFAFWPSRSTSKKK